MPDQKKLPPLRSLVLMFKSPRPGQVKTRLGESIGMDRAERIYRKMVERLVETVVCAENRSWHPVLCYTPGDDRDRIKDWLETRVSDDAEWIAQSGGDLGERLENVFAQCFKKGAKQVVVLGADCLDISVEEMNAVFASLVQHQVAIGPADDGGYWMIGMAAPHFQVFEEMPWSEPGLFEMTVQKTSALGLSVEIHQQKNDIDTAKDLERVSAELRREVGADDLD